jgi:peptidoglycan/LPS O-acetylase OafA/YrhL
MRFHNLQLLRVLAAVAVVGYHLDHYGRALFTAPAESTAVFSLWGFTGFAVPLFFALSGFVLTHALHSTPPARYLLARILRLYPGYWLALIVATVLISDGSLLADARTIARRMTKVELFLWPGGTTVDRMYLLGIEWSLFYEVELSVSLAALSLLGLRWGLPTAAIVWLGVIGLKMVVWPGYATELIPHWRTVLLSAFNVPFLFGVLAYYLRNTGQRWRWVVLAGLGMVVGVGIPRVTDGEQLWCLWGLAGALAVWFAVQVPQLSERNPFARLGDCTYGLFLIHVPVMMAVFRRAKSHGWEVGTVAGLLTAAVVALVGGLLFGWIESRIHNRLRPLAKVRLSDLQARWRLGMVGLVRMARR